MKRVRTVRFDVPFQITGICLLDQGSHFSREVNGVLAVPFFPYEQTGVPGAHPIVREDLLYEDMANPDLISRPIIRDPNAPPGRMNPAQPVESD